MLLLLPLPLPPHALQARGHLFAITQTLSSCATHICAYLTYDNHVLYIFLCLSIPKSEWKFNSMFHNACTHTPNISNERGEYLHSPYNTHITSANKLAELFLFFFFVRFFAVPSTNIREHWTWIHRTYTCHGQLISDSHPLSFDFNVHFTRICMYACVFSDGKILNRSKNRTKGKYIYVHVVQFTFWLLRKNTCHAKLPSTPITTMSRFISFHFAVLEISRYTTYRGGEEKTYNNNIIITLISTLTISIFFRLRFECLAHVFN